MAKENPLLSVGAREQKILSCDKNGSRVGTSVAVKNGITAVASRGGNVIGAMISQTGSTGQSVKKSAKLRAAAAGDKAKKVQGQMMRTMVGKPASATLSVVNNFGMPPSLNSLTPLAAAGALLSRNKGARSAILNVVASAQGARAVSVGIGTGVARLSRNGSAGQVEQRNYFDRPQIQVRMYPSRLSAALNASDIRGWPVAVKRSAGKMYENRGQTWHAGTTTVATPSGERRTMTHLQSLNWPGTHYYFNRALRDDEVAGMIGKHQAFPEPRDIKGFLGEVTEVESLAPTTAYLKRNLIQAHAFFGDSAD